MLRVFSSYAFERRGLTGAAWLRVGLSCVMLIEYIWHIGLHGAIWGAHGQFAFADYVRLNHGDPLALYAYSDSRWYNDLLFFGALVVAAINAVGIFPRLTCWLFAVSSYATFQRNMLAGDAGADLLVLVAFLLCFLDSSRYCSVFPGPRFGKRVPGTRAVGTMLHNTARFLIAWQVCMVYLWAAFYKLGGAEWRDGTAMYYVLHVERFQWFPSLSHAIASNGVIVTLLTYFTLIAQTAFPFLMWNQRVKPYIVATEVCMHLGIALLMGLLSFSATMIIVDVSLLSDAQFSSSLKWCRKSLGSILRQTDSSVREALSAVLECPRRS